MLIFPYHNTNDIDKYDLLFWNPKKADPSWAYFDPETKKRLRPSEKIGNHNFFRDGTYPGRSLISRPKQKE